MQKVTLIAVISALSLLNGCQVNSDNTEGDLSSYQYCSRNHKALATAYRHALARGEYSLQVRYVQPKNIKDKCSVKLWTMGKAGETDVSWHGECSEDGFASGLGLLMMYDPAGERDSVRLYEGDGKGDMVAYYGMSERSGKIWSGRDDSSAQTFFVASLDESDEGFTIAHTDYARAESYDFIFDDDSLAMLRLYPNYTEEFVRTYSDDDYSSDLFYSLFEIPKSGETHMTGVAFTYSGRDRSMSVMDAVDGKEPVVSDMPISGRYLNEVMDTQQHFVQVMNDVHYKMPGLMQISREKMQQYQNKVCSLDKLDLLHITKDEADEICSLKVLAPAK